MDLSAKQNRFQ